MPVTTMRLTDTGGAGIRFRVEDFDALMAARGITTMAAKAEQVGISRMTLHRWVTGATTPSVKDALKVARRLGVQVEALFEVRP